MLGSHHFDEIDRLITEAVGPRQEVAVEVAPPAPAYREPLPIDQVKRAGSDVTRLVLEDVDRVLLAS